MANLNENKVFYKIPIGLSYTPGKEQGGIKHRKMYAAYLYFKGINRFGQFKIQEAYGYNRDKANYWIRKLLKAGWVTKAGDLYYMKSYQEVWSMMGVEKVTKKKTGKEFYKYEKYPCDSVTKLIDYQIPILLDMIQKQCARQKANQLRFRLSNGGDTRKKGRVKSILKPEFSGKAAGTLFGYKSDVSGLKYRKKYFIVEQPKGRRLWVNQSLGTVCSMFFCGLILV